jgi:hypothetical protein
MAVCLAACDFCDGLFPVERMGSYHRIHAPPGERVRVVYQVCRRCFEEAQPGLAAAYFNSDAHAERKRKVAKLRDDLQQMIDEAVAVAVREAVSALIVPKARLADDETIPLSTAPPPTPPPGYRQD